MIVVWRKRRRRSPPRGDSRGRPCGTEPHAHPPRMLSRMRLYVSVTKKCTTIVNVARRLVGPVIRPGGFFGLFPRRLRFHTPGVESRMAIAVDDASPLLARFGFSGGTRLSVRALRRARACRRARRLSRSPSADPP